MLATANADGLTVEEMAVHVRASVPATVREFSEANLRARIQKALAKNSQTYGVLPAAQWVWRGRGAGITQRYVSTRPRPASPPPPREGEIPLIDLY